MRLSRSSCVTVTFHISEPNHKTYKTEKMKTSAIKLLCALVASLIWGGISTAQAQSGTWTNDASSVWSATTNWLNGTVADGIDATADFSTINITANRTNILDTSRTIGNLSFGDTNGAQFWLLNSSGGSVLTLATSSGTPTITTATNGANTFVAAINAPLAGIGGLIKAGNGVLALGGTNTYTGQTTVSGGTLAITNGPGGLQNGPGGLVAYYSFNNIVGNRVLNEGSGGALMDGMLVGNGGVSIGAGMGRFGDNCLNVTKGAVNNGANVGAMGNGGYMLVNNPVVPFTCTSGSAAANWSWALWIKTTTQGAAYMYQGNNGWASGNTGFYLNTGGAVTGGGVNAGGVRNSQGWQRGTATINDGNWHHIAMTCSAGTKTLYVDGAVDPWQANQWNGVGNGNQLWIGGTSDTFGDGSVQMSGLIDKVVVYNRPLTLAEVQMLTNNIVPGVAAPAIPLNSPVSVAAGAKLDANGYYATVTNLAGPGIVDSVISGGYIAANYGADTVFNGVITNTGASTLNFYKTGSGTMTNAGLIAANNVVVRQGTLTLSGSGLITTNGANNTITVADGTERAILDIPSGSTVVARNLVLGGISASANGGGGAGAVYNRGTYRNFGNTGTGAFALGNATGGANPANNGYGYFLLDSATSLNLGESGVGGLAGGDGVFEVKSGTANFTNWITLSRCQGTVSGQQQRSLMLVRGGTVNGPNFNNEDRWNWSGSTIGFYTVMDIGAGGSLDSLGTLHNINMGNDNNVNAISILTVDNGGFLRVNNINSGAANPNCTVNFNNAILAPTVATTTFLGANLDNVFVYSGGVTFSNDLNIGAVAQLKAPTDSSITSIPLTSGGSGYIGRPIVQITDGSGVGATAIAEWDQNLGTVTGITITAPGSGYSSPTVTLVGGGATTPATLGTPVLGTALSGGLTKIGAGTLTLSGGYTYTGNTVIQGGGFAVPTSLVIPSTAGDLLVSNANLTLDLSSGASLPVNNLTLQNNVTNNFNYGTLSVNPANPAINANGTISAPGSGIVINITAFGLQTGQFPLIKYTGTALGSIANFSLGSLPPGVVANLVNNTGNDSIDLQITSTGQNLSWYGLLPDGINVSSNWDITLTTNWVSVGTTTPALRYQEYTSGGVTVGDPVRFDDTLYNDGINPQATNINLTMAVRPFQFVVDSTLPYSIQGAGSIVGQGGILKSNTGSLTLLTSNSFSGGITIAGGSVVITNDTALGTNNGTVSLNTGTLQINGNMTNNTRVLAVPASSTIGVATNVVARFGGTVSGAGGLTKTDNGTLVLAGSNSLTGTLTVNQGTLMTVGTNILPAVPLIGNSASFNGVLNVAGGLFQDNNNPAQVYNTSLTIGNTAGAAGDMIVSGGTVTIPKQLTVGPVTYGAFNQSGGTTTIGGYIAVGGTASGGVFNQSGGTVNVTNAPVTIGYIANTSLAAMNLSGTAVFNMTGPAGSQIQPGEVGSGTLNVSGSAALTIANDGVVLGKNNAAGLGTLNLLGGVVTARSVSKGVGTGWLNFNGGTLKANLTSSSFIAGLNGANIYANGATLDDGGFAITIPQALLSATGVGVSSIALSSGGSGYIDSPIVTISGGSGSNATATATVSGGVVTAVVVTSPGTGYSLSDSLSVSFSGGGASAVAPTVSAVNLANNSGGGLTKKGAGTVTLTGSNTITGAVSVNTGALTINTLSSLVGGAAVSNTASLTITQVGSATNNMGALTLNGGAAVPGATLGIGLTGLNSTTPFVNCGTLTLNGTNTLSIAGALNLGAIPAVKYSSLAGSGTLTNLTLPQGVSGYISNSVTASTIFVVVTNTGPGLVWTGFNTNAALTNLWDINSTTNWLLGATPTTYRQPIIPGDSVTFDDSGSGTVRLNTNVGPASLTISNNSVTYTFSGSGTISGSAGISKLGSGTAILNLTNNTYSGDTTISNGTLRVGSVSAISSAANLNVGPLGTLDLAGFSESVNGLSGSGTVNNSGGTTAVLTTGGGNASSVWNGTITNTGAGGITFVKIGTGALAIDGTNFWSGNSLINGGSLELTPGASVNGTGEFRVGDSSTATFTNNGGTLSVPTWVVIGRTTAAANGTMVVNSGTVQKTGANNIVVGSVGATGTLIVNGGQVLNNGNLWLGEGATANGYLYLNGGLIQATQVRPNGATPLSSIAYFNGGTLQATASSASYLQVSSMVMSNGLVLDDNGFDLTINSVALQDGDGLGGGFIKKGSGNVYLDTSSSYTGTTVVTNGTLAGIGTIIGPVVVAPAGTLGAGDAGATVGTFTINNNLILQGKAALRVSKTGGTPVQDNITVSGNIDYTGSTLVVTNITSDATPLTTSDTFQLFSVSGSVTGTPTVIGSPGAGLAFNFNPANGVLSVVNGVNTNPTNLVAVVNGGNLELSWPADHTGWRLQVQTNSLATGLGTNWVDVPNTATVNSVTNALDPAAGSVFYRMVYP
jgi:fibronectin-binding autotransporter adhesin